jgi:hypothetical protein
LEPSQTASILPSSLMSYGAPHAVASAWEISSALTAAAEACGCDDYPDAEAMAEELERVTTTPGAGGALLVPHREDGASQDALPDDFQAILKVVSVRAEPSMAKDVCLALGKGVQPGQVEPMRGKLKRLAERGWLHRTRACRFTTR